MFHLNGNFSLWWKSLGNDTKAKKELTKKLKKMNKNTNFENCNKSGDSLNFNKEYYKELSIISENSNISKIKNEKLISNIPEDIEKEINKELYSLKFIMFVIIIFIKNSSSALFLNCFKMMALKIIKNDGLASIIYCISTLADIFGRFAVPYSWKKYGFYNTHIYNFFYNIFFNLLFIISGYHTKSTFIIVFAYQSLTWSFGYLLGHTTMFLFLNQEKLLVFRKLLMFIIFYKVYIVL